MNLLLCFVTELVFKIILLYLITHRSSKNDIALKLKKEYCLTFFYSALIDFHLTYEEGKKVMLGVEYHGYPGKNNHGRTFTEDCTVSLVYCTVL